MPVMVDLDIAPATVTGTNQYHAGWARAILADGKLYVMVNAGDPRVDQVFDVAGPHALIGSAYVVTLADGGEMNITTCGCAKGSWVNYTAEHLMGLATPVNSEG